MKRYNLYIGRNLLHSMLLVTFSLTGIIWLSQALRLMDFIVDQGISVGLFLELTMLLIPSTLLLILPIATFIAGLFVYNKLLAESELIALEAVGLSRWELARPLMQLAVGVMLVGYMTSLYLMPLSYTKYRDLKDFLRNNYVSLLLQEGVFSNPVDGLTVFVRERDADGTLHGILVHDNRENDMSVTMMAEEGKLMETPQGPRFFLVHGNRQEVRDKRLSFLNFDNYTLDISLYTGSAAERKEETQEKYLGELLDEASQMPKETASRLMAEVHQRILWPLYSISLPLIGVAVAITGRFQRRGQWRRILSAVGVASAMFIVLLVLRAFMFKAPIYIILGYASAILPLFAACWMLREKKLSSSLRAYARQIGRV